MPVSVTHVGSLPRDDDIDFVSDGESMKLSYATYVKDRLHGFEGDSTRRLRALPRPPRAPDQGRRHADLHRPAVPGR